MGNTKISFIPKTEKLKSSFLIRASKNYNKVPAILRDLESKTFNKQLKNHLLGKPIELPGNINLNFDEMR